MKFAIAAAVLPLAFASPVEEALLRRADNAAKVQSDLSKAANDLSTFKSFLDTIPTAGPISSNQEITLQNDEQAIYNDVKAATTDTNNSSPGFTSAESQAIFNQVNNLLTPTQAALTDVVNHKAAFTSASLIGLVCSDLSQLKSQIDSLAAALEAKGTQPYVGQGPALQQKYDTAFANAQSSLGC